MSKHSCGRCCFYRSGCSLPPPWLPCETGGTARWVLRQTQRAVHHKLKRKIPPSYPGTWLLPAGATWFPAARLTPRTVEAGIWCLHHSRERPADLPASRWTCRSQTEGCPTAAYNIETPSGLETRLFRLRSWFDRGDRKSTRLNSSHL